jgi:hypothetical protein
VSVDWTAEAVQHHPQNSEILVSRAELLFLAQEPGEALAHWEKMAELKPAMALAKWICQWLQYAQHPNGSQAPRLEPGGSEFEMSREFLRCYRRLVSWQAVDMVDVINRELSSLQVFLPSAAQLIRTAVRAADQEHAEAGLVAQAAAV